MASPEFSLYVGCGLTQAPEDFKQEVEAFKDALREDYIVFDFIGLVEGTAEDVYRWDIEHCTAKSDLFVAVCDYPSIGLGYELSARVRDFKKPALAVAAEASLITRVVLGVPHPNYTFRRYGSLLVDVPIMIEEELTKLKVS